MQGHKLCLLQINMLRADVPLTSHLLELADGSALEKW